MNPEQAEESSGVGLEGNVALVTGANRGIGAAIARAMAREGAAVGVHFHAHRDEAEAVAAAIRAAGGRSEALQADVTCSDDVRRAVERCQSALGPVDILVNNARQLARAKKFIELSWDDYQLQIDVILKGAFHCCQAVLPSMMERRKGRIISLLSTDIGEQKMGKHAYGTAKSALLFFSQCLACEIAPFGITVNMVSPGLTLVSERPTLHSDDHVQKYIRDIPMGRLGSLEDTAEAVAFLAGDKASFITGVNLAVCGGRVMF